MMGIGGLVPVITAVSTAAGGWAGVTTGLTTALTILTGPIGIIIAVLLVLAGVFVYLWTTNEGFRDGIISVWNSIAAKVGEVVGIVKPLIDELSADLVATVQAWMPIIGPILDLLSLAFGVAFQLIAANVGVAINVVLDLLGGLVDFFGNVIGLVLALLRGDWTDAWKHLVEAVKAPIESSQRIFNDLVKGITEGIGGIAGTILGAGTGIGDAMYNLIKPAIDVVNDLLDKASKIPGLGGLSSYTINVSKPAAASNTVAGVPIPPRTSFISSSPVIPGIIRSKRIKSY
jgi:phage-related protein